jgi:hypothetical protein
MQRLLTTLTVFAALGLLAQGVASAAPTPAYDITCVVGGETTVTWSHAKLDQAVLEWFTAGATTPYATTDPIPLSPHPPHGFILTSAGTGIGTNVPATVVAFFEHADGSGTDNVQADCN